MSLRSTLKATLQQADDHAIVYWSKEDCVSVVALSKFTEPPVVGEVCKVLVGKKSYDGTKIKIGTLIVYSCIIRSISKSACM